MFDNDSDVERMRRVQKGDRTAFAELFATYEDPLAGFFFHLCWDANRTQDLVQETFLRLWKAAAAYRGQGRFSTYLFQIAKNLWINERARDARRPAPQPLDRDEDDEGPAGRLPDGRPSPLQQMLDREDVAAVRKAVASLDPKKQMVFVLSEYQGLSYARVAELLGIPEGTVKSRMAAAERLLREKLRRTLRDEGGS